MRKYVCYRAPGPAAIDGEIQKPFWAGARWTDDFVDIEGDVKPKPRFRTRAKMLWDDECLYIAADLEEPHVWATLTEHDSVIFQDNDFEVFIDPDGDNHLYAELELNALNTTWDLLLPKPYRDGGPAINGWEIHGLKTAVKVLGRLNDPSFKDIGWTLEIAIPWKALNELSSESLPPRAGQHVRLNFSRVEWRHEVVQGRYRKIPNTPEDNWVWSPQGAIDMHRPEMWGLVEFSDAHTGLEEAADPPDWPVRKILMAVYHAQRQFFLENGRWAESLVDLGFSAENLRLQSTAFGWEASLGCWHVREDSLLRRKR